MKLYRVVGLLLLGLISVSLTACSAFSVSNRDAEITVESQPKQPSVIVN